MRGREGRREMRGKEGRREREEGRTGERERGRVITYIYNLNSYPINSYSCLFYVNMMHVIILFRNFLHWYVISVKLTFMHKLGIISCLIDD